MINKNENPALLLAQKKSCGKQIEGKVLFKYRKD